MDTVDVEAAEEASKLIADANDNLRRIKTLYHTSQAKFTEFTKALKARDSVKAKEMSAELSLMINDGYILAENAKAKIVEAQEKNINPEWKEYLKLKEDTLDLQIKAFNFRRKSADLFGAEFGGENKAALARASQKYMQNEESFKKYMEEAKKKNKEANELAKKAAKEDGKKIG